MQGRRGGQERRRASGETRISGREHRDRVAALRVLVLTLRVVEEVCFDLSWR